MGRPAASVDVFRAIADPTRRRLLDLLREGEQPVAELARAFAVTLPAVSQHLKVLREADLVQERREGRQRLYRVNAAPLAEVSDWVAHYEHFWRERMSALGRYLDAQSGKEKGKS